ncbi:MAG: hypothetical protein ACRDM9_03550 [Gaiellaceae bacterium]
MRRGFTKGGVATLLAVTLAVAVAAATPAGRTAVAAAQPSECPTIMTTDEVSVGMTGTGLTVVQGRNPVSFDAEVLGILDGFPGPGRKVVIAELSGPPLDQAGGVWFGASGSPVYMDDPVSGEEELLGAVAFGFSFGPSNLAGLTPAEDMDDLLDPGGAAARLAGAERTALSRSLRARVAARVGVAPAAIGSLVRLKTPLSVSGLNPRGMRRLQQAIDRQDLPFVPYAGAAASASSAAAADLEAGGNFAAALSLGDVTAAGIGTTTFVCLGQAVAFGHPFTWTGNTTLAARAADAITIAKDPVSSPFKLANVAENAGTVKEDRLAGIRANLGDAPPTIPVQTSVTDLDRGNARDGQSDVVLEEFLPFLVFEHTFTNIDVTIDRIGPGNSELHWTIEGTRAGGVPWELSHTNHYASPFDISFESVFEVSDFVSILSSFTAEPIHITSVDLTKVDVEEAFEAYRLSKVLVWNGRDFVKKDFVRRRPGGRILLRAVLRPQHVASTVNVDLLLRVPANARRSGFIEVQGGGSLFGEIPCFFEDGEGECGESEPATFDTLLSTLSGVPRNDQVTARLRLGEPPRVRAKAVEQVDAIVQGSRTIAFELIGG